MEFAEQTLSGGVPSEERVAVFDNDGTLWCEKPMPIQADFMIRIWSRTGRRPLLAAGNSNGDLPMLEFTQHPAGSSIRRPGRTGHHLPGGTGYTKCTWA